VNFLASSVGTYFVVYNAVNLGGTTPQFSYLVAGLSGGIALGALMVGRIRARRFAGPLIALSVVVVGLLVEILAFSHSFAVSLPAAAGVGVAIGLVNATYFATVQGLVSNEYLGRVVSIDSVANFVSVPIGIAFGGALIAWKGVGFEFLVAGIGLLANGLVASVLPGIREFRSAE